MSNALLHPTSLVDPAAIRHRHIAFLLGLLAASGSIVFVEPAPYDLLAILLFLGLVITGLRFPRELHVPLLLLSGFVIGNVVAATLAPDPGETIRSLSIRVYMVLTWTLLVAVLVLQPRRLLTALWAGYTIAALIAVAWGSLEYLGVLGQGEWAGGLRARGSFKDPNVYGPFLVPAAIYAMSRIARGGRAERIVYGILFLVFAVGELISFSRGAWINFTCALGLFTVMSIATADTHRQRLQWLLTAGLAMVVVSSVLAAAISIDVIGDRFFQRAVLTQKYDTEIGGRFDTQIRTLEHIGTDPVGVGPGRSDEVFGLEPHNLYLHVLVESGWLGGLSLFGFIALTLAACARLVPRHWALRDDVLLVMACLPGVLLQSLFIDSTHWRHMWLLFAVAWALIIAARRVRGGNFMSKQGGI